MRTVSAPLTASVFFIPAFFITQVFFPDVGERFGFYLPIIVGLGFTLTMKNKGIDAPTDEGAKETMYKMEQQITSTDQDIK